jgi:NADPH:quinone reductase-like Zn-dependent oxidoreductase
MKHLVLTQFGTPSESVALHDDGDPVPGPGDVLVRMEAAAVNPSDLLLLRGVYLARPEPPAPVGGEGVGIVVDAGAQADHGLLGERVIVLPTYTYGTWAEKVVVPQDKVVEVAPDADPLQLAMLSINPATAHVMLNRFVDLKPGDWVAQPGANSAVGRLVITLADLRGLKTLNVVRRDEAADEVRAAGGEHVLVSGPDLAADIARELDGEQLSLVLDGLGGDTATALVGALRFGGTIVTYGSLGGGPSQVPNADLLGRELRHTGFWLLTWLSHAPRSEIVDTYRYLGSLVADGSLSVPVEATYRLDDYRRALEHAGAAKRGGKVLFAFDQPQ